MFKLKIFSFTRKGDQEVGNDAPVFDAQQQEATKLDSVAAWIFIVGVFLLPLFFLPLEEGPVELGKTVLLSTIVFLGLLVWLTARLKSGIFMIPKNVLLVSGFLIVLIFLLATIFSQVFNTSFGGFVYDKGTFVSTGILFLLMFLGATLFQSVRLITYLFGAFFGAFALIFLFHISRLILGVDFLSFGIFNSTVASTVGKWNDLAIFSGFITILALLTIEFAPALRGRLKILLYGFLLASLILLALVNFFVVWLILGAMALIILVYNLSFSQLLSQSKARRFSTAPIVVLLISVLFLSTGTLGTTIAEYANISHIEVRPSWQATFSIIEDTWNTDLLLGSGPNRFVNQWVSFKPDGINETFFWNTDFTLAFGLIPTFAVTTGLLGILSWAFFLLAFLYVGFRSLFISSNPTLRFITMSSFLLSLYLWIMSIFYVPSVIFLGFAFLLTGVLSALLIMQNTSKNFVFSVVRDPRIGFVSVLVLIILLIGSSLGLYSLFEKHLSLVYLREGRVSLNNGDIENATSALTKAINANPHETLYRLLTEVKIAKLNSILNRQNVSIESIRDEFQQTLGEAISSGQGGVTQNETDYASWVSLGRVYGSVVPLNIPGAYENARASYERALLLNPRSPAIVFERAQLEAANGDVGAAKDFINKALEMRSVYTDAIFLLAQLDINDGNVRGAISSLERVSLINPNDIGLFFRLGLLKYSNGDYKGTISALERAVELSSDYSNAKYFLGLSYYNVNRVDEAIRQFEGIQVLNPDNTEVPQILENLKAGNDPFKGILAPTGSSVSSGEPPIEE